MQRMEEHAEVRAAAHAREVSELRTTCEGLREQLLAMHQAAGSLHKMGSGVSGGGRSGPSHASSEVIRGAVEAAREEKTREASAMRAVLASCIASLEEQLDAQARRFGAEAEELRELCDSQEQELLPVESTDLSSEEDSFQDSCPWGPHAF